MWSRSLADKARTMGIAPDDYPRKGALKRRVQEAARYAPEPRIGLVFVLSPPRRPPVRWLSG